MKVQPTEMIEDSVGCGRKSPCVLSVLGEEAQLCDALIERLKAVKFFIFKGTLTTLYMSECMYTKHIHVCIIKSVDSISRDGPDVTYT